MEGMTNRRRKKEKERKIQDIPVKHNLIIVTNDNADDDDNDDTHKNLHRGWSETATEQSQTSFREA